MPNAESPDSVPEFTGERVVPGLVDINLFNEHLSRYEFARQFASGKRVLDAGCGTGYGAAALASSASSVTGIDVSGEAVEYARLHYPAANLSFETGSCTELPGGGYDLITAFEVIEHLPDWPAFLREARRVLAPQGRFLVSTPNKLYYADSRRAAGPNPFHEHEFEYQEFARELLAVFPHVEILLQNHAEAIVFSGNENTTAASSRVAPDPNEAHFYLAVCAFEPFPQPDTFAWLPSTANVLRERERHIELLQGEVRLKTEWIARQKAERDELLALLRAEIAEKEKQALWTQSVQAEAEFQGRRILALQQELESDQAAAAATVAQYEAKLADLEDENRAKTEWARETERRLDQSGQELVHCAELLTAAERTVEERTFWARSLERELGQMRGQWAALRGAPLVRAAYRLKLLK